MTALDISLSIFYFVFILTMGILYTRIRRMNHESRGRYLGALCAKLIGGMSFALVYTFYYNYGGDSKSYFNAAQVINELILDDFGRYVGVFFSDVQTLRTEYWDVVGRIPWGPDSSEWFVVKFVAILSVLGGFNYFATTLIFAYFSFIGVYMFYRVFEKRYPLLRKYMALSILFVPSVFFWGSGIMKDSIVIGFLGVILFHLQVIIERRAKHTIRSIVVVIIATYVIMSIKVYVIMSLVPACLIWFIMTKKDVVKSRFVRRAIAPLFLVVTVVAVGYSVVILSKLNEKYSIDGVLYTARGMQTWHYVEGANSSENHGRGSSYSLGEYEPSFTGVFKQFLPAVNVTFFRPYLTEVKNPVMFLAAVESTVILLLSVYIVFGLGVFRLFRVISSDAFLMMCLSFAIFFGFAVGFTSYNFGALVRYKIPCIPFYLCSLFILRQKVRESKWARLRSRSNERMHKKQAFSR